MQVEMDTLKAKHTWDLVKAPPGANVMDSMWVFDIKWDGEGNRIRDKARLVGKGYTQQLGVDYNETWAGVTRLESVTFFPITILLLHLFHTILPNSLVLRTRGYTRNHYRDSLQSLSMTHTLIADSLTYNYT